MNWLLPSRGIPAIGPAMAAVKTDHISVAVVKTTPEACGGTVVRRTSEVHKRWS